MLTYKMLVYKMFTYKLQQAEQLKYAPKVLTFGAYFLRQYAVLNCYFSNVHISADCVLCIRVIMQPTVGYGPVADVFPAKSEMCIRDSFNLTNIHEWVPYSLFSVIVTGVSPPSVKRMPRQRCV